MSSKYISWGQVKKVERERAGVDPLEDEDLGGLGVPCPFSRFRREPVADEDDPAQQSRDYEEARRHELSRTVADDASEQPSDERADQRKEYDHVQDALG